MIETMLSCLGLTLLLITAAAAVLRWQRRVKLVRWGVWPLAATLLLLALPCAALAGYLGWRWAFPNAVAQEATLFEGVSYECRVLRGDHVAVVHVVRVDLRTPGLVFVGSPVLDTPAGLRHPAATVSSFVRDSGADVAINASFFRPFREKHPLDYHPHEGDVVEPMGFTRSRGRTLGVPVTDWPVLNLMPDGTATIGEGRDDAAVAVSGRSWLVRDGVPQAPDVAQAGRYPRTAVALDRESTTLILIVVDGKQPRYSDGMTLADLATFLRTLGAHTALELDGGGSSTLVIRDPTTGKPRQLNRPCHVKVPRWERPVANHIGIRVNAVDHDRGR